MTSTRTRTAAAIIAAAVFAARVVWLVLDRAADLR